MSTEPERAATAPAIKDCVIIVHRDRQLMDEVTHLLSSIDGRLSNCCLGGRILTGSISIRANSVSEWMPDDGEWFSRNEPFKSHPVFDASTDMDALRNYMCNPMSEQDMPKKKKKEDSRDRKPSVPTPGSCIIYGLDPQLSEDVQYILFDAGHSWFNSGERNIQCTGSKIIIAGDYLSCDKKTCIGHDIGSLYKVTSIKKSWPVFDASKELPMIYEFFGVKPMPIAIERLVRPGLLNLIKTIPRNEMVAGFIRRDLNLVLPLDVQSGGADPICDWILEQKTKKGNLIPIIKKNDYVFRFKWFKRVRNPNDYEESKMLTVASNILVPDETMEGFLSDGSGDDLYDWIESNIEISVEESSEENSGYEDSGFEMEQEWQFSNFRDLSDTETKFDSILESWQ